MPAGVIVYYIVGPVHLHNVGLIAQQMPDWEFRVAYESNVAWFTPGQMKALDFETVPLSGKHVPEQLWNGNVRAIIFSTTQLRQTPVDLIQEAVKRNIPTMAIEESIQVALNTGRINNYLLPVDHLLVASRVERQGMVAEGVPPQNVEVTGWPFYTGQVGKPSHQLVRERKAQFGLDADRPVASLTLTALGDAGESPEVRRRQLSLAASGLPDNYQLVVKPHPIEPLERLEPFIREISPQAKVIPGKLPIADLIEATDVLLNRGVSQVCFQALMREIPVIILDMGTPTPFHGLVPDELIMSEASELPRALDRVSREGDVLRLYKKFMAEHFPYTPAEAREITCRRITEIAQHARDETVNETQWFALAIYQAWLGNPPKVLENLSNCQGKQMGAETDALKRLVYRQATAGDMETLRSFLGPGFTQSVLKTLWITQLDKSRRPPTEQEVTWLQDYPPTTNTSWFIPSVHRWAAILIRTGNQEALSGLVERLALEFSNEDGLDVLLQQLRNYRTNFAGRMKYYRYATMLAFRQRLRPGTRWLSKLIRKIRS